MQTAKETETERARIQGGYAEKARLKQARQQAGPHTIAVGGLGIVARNVNREEARRLFGEYVHKSRKNIGLASGQDVHWFKSAAPHRSYWGSIMRAYAPFHGMMEAPTK